MPQRLANAFVFLMIRSSQYRRIHHLILAITAGSLASSAFGAQYLMDFNSHTGGTSSHPGGAAAWNIYAAPADISGGGIKDSTGSTAAGLTFNKSGTITDSNNTGALAFNNATGGPSWVTDDGALGNTGAAADYFYTSLTTGSQSFTMTFSGLASGSVVSLDLFFSRADANSGNGFYSYSLDGGATWLGLNVLEKNGSLSTDARWASSNTLAAMFRGQEDGNNQARYMNASDLTIGASGTLQFKVQDDAGGGWAGINAARLTVIPEPSTAALLAGVACVATFRRRRVG